MKRNPVQSKEAGATAVEYVLTLGLLIFTLGAVDSLCYSLKNRFESSVIMAMGGGTQSSTRGGICRTQTQLTPPGGPPNGGLGGNIDSGITNERGIRDERRLNSDRDDCAD